MENVVHLSLPFENDHIIWHNLLLVKLPYLFCNNPINLFLDCHDQFHNLINKLQKNKGHLHH